MKFNKLKQTKKYFLFFCSLLLIPAVSLAETVENEILIPINKIKIDQSIRSGQVRISAYGNLSNSCIDMKNKKIFEISPFQHQVTILGTQYEGVCLTVVTPYRETFEINGLSKGEHTFLFLTPEGFYTQKVVNIL